MAPERQCNLLADPLLTSSVVVSYRVWFLLLPLLSTVMTVYGFGTREKETKEVHETDWHAHSRSVQTRYYTSRMGK